jgi:DNA-binding response OmpR family regulator
VRIVVCDDVPELRQLVRFTLELQAITRINKTAPRTGIVIFTGFGGPAMRDQALSLGADAYVEKGADLAELRSVVTDVGRRKAGLRSPSAGS